ncbi:sensor histidine kinase [Yersinia pekkanenii]|uniref:Sensor histidine kinase DcuS n=1 Tax=Yersinia pekkanenii TaxID=1288385 RepID=A0A0T9PQH2_9GAMM|nr:sensor histidine kinase [Yersinia pekkanenii]CNH76787.1 sensory histidine kinase DcuS [Yersinia pekkanenii]CRY68599.1 sensory histidine kinase DcuS [Yersinia pekkanenii]
MNNATTVAKQKVPLRLSTSITLMVSAVIVSVLLVVHTLFFIQLSQMAHDSLQDKAVAVARTLSFSPTIIKGLSDPVAGRRIQAYASEVQTANNLLFIVVTDMNGIRYSHPNPGMIGQHFIGNDLQPALQGKENSAINRGVLEQALRIFVPVYQPHGKQIGVVAIGISLTNINSVVSETRWTIPWTLLFGVLIGSVGTWFLVKVLKRIMLGFEPYEISNLFEQRNAMLQSIKEGVIAVDANFRITVVNHEAKRLFKQSGPIENLLLSHASKYWPVRLYLQQVLETGIARRDEEINVNGRILLTNTVPVRVNGEIIGVIATFRDKTEVSQLMQRLTGMAHYADALRAQSHEFMNKLHVILGLLHMKYYQQVEDYIVKTSNHYQADIGSLLRKIKSPVIAGFLLGKINRAHDLGITLSISDDSLLPNTHNEQVTTTLITVLGNLIENAIEAIGSLSQREITVSFHYQQGRVHCVVSDDGPGIQAALQDRIFDNGFSTKGNEHGIGLSLVRQSLERIGGNIEFDSDAGVFTQFFISLPYDTMPGDIPSNNINAVNHD